MLIDLVPEFLAALSAPDPLQAYHRYLDEHRAVLSAYWHNYVLDLDSPHAESVILRALAAPRRDLQRLLNHVDIAARAEEALDRCQDVFEIDRPIQLYLMVGVGAANAGELVVNGQGVAFVCLEHFTGRPNPDTYGMGLAPEQMAVWIAHEVAHLVRYTSPASRSEIPRILHESHGFYDYWESGSRATLRELLVNEGLAVAAARAVAPDAEPWVYLGYSRRQYRRMRELDAFLRRSVEPELDRTGLGYRLRYLSGGMSPGARLVNGKVIPERAGYYLGWRMVEALVNEVGVAAALRASPLECFQAAERATGAQTA
ncbi:MAG: hypothetical protein HY560_03475 [Gemmatimonadetes bacterium]|nr:hypothetical protein [Gemmatimonadota bacterium]